MESYILIVLTLFLLMLERLQSAVESSEEEIRREVPSFVDPMRFDTLRFRYMATNRIRRDGPAKAIVDVSKVTEDDYAQGGNPHKPLKALCPDIWIDFGRLPIGVYHYLGSWESFSYREDARDGHIRSYEKWQGLAGRQEGGADDVLRPWISGFVDLIEEEAAKPLLRDAGLPRDYRRPYRNATVSSGRL